MNTYGKTYTQAKRWLDQQLSNHVITFEEIMVHFNMKLTKTRVDKQFFKLTEEQQALAAQFNIRSIPTLMIFKQGKMLTQQSGAMPAASFNQWLESHIAEI